MRMNDTPRCFPSAFPHLCCQGRDLSSLILLWPRLLQCCTFLFTVSFIFPGLPYVLCHMGPSFCVFPGHSHLQGLCHLPRNVMPLLILSARLLFPSCWAPSFCAFSHSCQTSIVTITGLPWVENLEPHTSGLLTISSAFLPSAS